MSSLIAQTITITGHGGDEIEAYEARPASGHRRGGMVVIHHLPGYDRATKEIVRRFAEMGYDAVCPNLFHREAPGAAPDDAAAAARAKGGPPDERVVGDVAAAAAHLRALDSSNGKVGVIGFCSGGRQTVLVACSTPVDAAIDCYGAYVIGDAPAESPVRMTNLEALLPNLGCPLLGLFGKDDKRPSPGDVERLAEILTANGKDFEFHSYDGAGHAFFAVDRPAYRVEAAVDGWEKITDFLNRRLH
ncbi:MAG TPA: dienelactone hydrolase family protein [Jatrophihabitantaceae bacterium]|jgi:carboxymethylenebutenolidase